MSRPYQPPDDEQEIIPGRRGDDFRDMIRTLITRARVKNHVIDLLSDRESMKLYDQCFTSAVANPNQNYEIMELLGDVVAGHFIKKYMFYRFPQLKCHAGVKVLARLLINYGSKHTFHKIAHQLGFWPFITAGSAERITSKKSLLEDVFEAFIGTTEYLIDNRIAMGAGFAICYDLLSSIFDEMEISLAYEDLFDANTILKELFDKHWRELGPLNYEEEFDRTEEGYSIVTSRVYRMPGAERVGKGKNRRYIGGKKILLGTGVAAITKDAQQRASKKAIEALKKEGYEREPPPEYCLFNQVGTKKSRPQKVGRAPARTKGQSKGQSKGPITARPRGRPKPTENATRPARSRREFY